MPKWVIGIVILTCIALGVTVATAVRVRPATEIALAAAEQNLPPGSIVKVHSTKITTDSKDKDGTRTVIFVITCTADQRAVSRDPACTGQVELIIDGLVAIDHMSLWDSVKNLVTRRSWLDTITMTSTEFHVVPEPWYQSLADDPYKANPANLKFEIDHRVFGMGIRPASQRVTKRDVVFTALAESLSSLALGKVDDAVMFCMNAAKYAVVSGAGHDEYEHVRKLVIAKLPPNSPDIPPPLDQYNDYRKKLGLKPLKLGMKL